MNSRKKTSPSRSKNTMIIKDENKCRVRNKVEEWKNCAAVYDDEYLARLRTAMLKVFCEESPKYNIEKEKRIFALPGQKKSHYSDDIREGLAVELAIIGNNSNLLINCSAKTREQFAAEVIQQVFTGMTWKRLATLDQALPFMAEASPDVFLNEMITLVNNKTIIHQLMEDEGNIFQGGFHWLGIVHALETLAWEPEYLTTIISIATNQSLIDRESSIHPRPKDILLGLFWPWKPQTLANEAKLAMAANYLFLQNKDLAWDVLSNSIDSHVGSNHRYPRIRKVLDNKNNRNAVDINRGRRLIRAYNKVLLDIAESDVLFVARLVKKIHLFKESTFWKRALAIITSQVVLDKDDGFKEPLWAHLSKFCIKNRVYNNMEWAFSEDKLKEIDLVLEALKPKSIISQSKHLFGNSTSDWYESKNYTAEIRKFEEKQNKAVNSIYSRNGLKGVVELAQQVENSTLIGAILSNALKIKLDKKTILSLLDDPRKKTQDLIFGYLYHAYSLGGDKWLSAFRNVKWSVTQKVSFMICLPLLSSVCQFAETWLGINESLFWKDYRPPIVPQEDKDRMSVIKKSLKYNRPDITVGIFSWLRFNKESIDFDFCTTALLELAKTDDVKKFDHWEITQLIVDLQSMPKSDKQKNKLMQVEFYYLPLLDSNLHKGLSPATLYSALADDPKFFHQVITYAYNSEIPEKNLEVNDDLRKNAFTLMFQWNIMPGIVNGIFDYDVFMRWYKKVVKLCNESGHLRVAQLHIGETLYHAPKDPDGFWIDKRIAALLDIKENDALRNGYHCAAYNSRGARVVDFSGKREHAAAEEQIKKAEELECNNFQIFAEVFLDLAKLYEEESKRAIKEGERFKRQDTDEL